MNETVRHYVDRVLRDAADGCIWVGGDKPVEVCRATFPGNRPSVYALGELSVAPKLLPRIGGISQTLGARALPGAPAVSLPRVFADDDDVAPGQSEIATIGCLKPLG